eukprot:6007290-Heterocapsa_arctica.AAC.1
MARAASEMLRKERLLPAGVMKQTSTEGLPRVDLENDGLLRGPERGASACQGRAPCARVAVFA